MTLPGFDPDKAARRLAAAWQAPNKIQALPPDETPCDLEQAYLIQSRLMAYLNQGVAGWKAASASPPSLRGETAARPCYGRLLASRVFQGEGTRGLPAGASLMIELELAFRFGRTVRPANETLDVPGMIDGVLAAFEVVSSRFVDRHAVGQPSFVADNAGFDTLIFSAQTLALDDLATLCKKARVSCQGTLVRDALPDDTRTDPLMSLQFVWNQLARHDLAINKGDIVTTGTLIDPIVAHTAARYEGRIGDAVIQLDVTT